MVFFSPFYSSQCNIFWVCTTQTCSPKSVEQDLNAGHPCVRQYLIFILCCHIFYFLKAKLQLLWFGYCTWAYCDFDNITINCSPSLNPFSLIQSKTLIMETFRILEENCAYWGFGLQLAITFTDDEIVNKLSFIQLVVWALKCQKIVKKNVDDSYFLNKMLESYEKCQFPRALI